MKKPYKYNRYIRRPLAPCQASVRPVIRVMCIDCAHYSPNQYGQSGIGDCALGEVWKETKLFFRPGPPYPYVKRDCYRFQAIKKGE